MHARWDWGHGKDRHDQPEDTLARGMEGVWYYINTAHLKSDHRTSYNTRHTGHQSIVYYLASLLDILVYQIFASIIRNLSPTEVKKSNERTMPVQTVRCVTPPRYGVFASRRWSKTD